MKIQRCDRFDLMAYLESQESVLVYAIEEYGRSLCSLEGSSSGMTEHVRRLYTHDCECVEARGKRIFQLHDQLKNGGGAECSIEFAPAEYDNLRVCIPGTDDCGCHGRLTPKELRLFKQINESLWASVKNL